MLLFAKFAIISAEKKKKISWKIDWKLQNIKLVVFFKKKTNLGKSEYIAKWVFCFFWSTLVVELFCTKQSRNNSFQAPNSLDCLSFCSMIEALATKIARSV